MSATSGTWSVTPPVAGRLSERALTAWPGAARRWRGPALRPEATGVVHLGIGAFHRAHQAVFTEDAAALGGDPRWGICGVSQRSASVVEQLAPQDGLYSVLERGAGAAPLRVVGAVREVLFAGADPGAVGRRIADPAVHVVTLTVTEKGYRRRGSGGLDLDDAEVAADLAADPLRDGARPRTAVGQLARGLQRRMRAGGEPVTVLSCDNLTGNGEVLATLVAEFCAALPAAEGAPLLQWIDANVRFPSSMVDRIVPATTEADRALAAEVLGLRDEGLVVTEPFRQWVIEDSFAGPRPPWELAGALLTDRVAPWEAAKLRLLNATHSTLAYLGALHGYPTIAEAVGDPQLAEIASRLMAEDATPTLDLPAALDVVAYRTQLLERFANPALAHRTVQVAMDGSQKLPVRMLGIVADRLAAGALPRWALLGVAGWMAYVATAARGGTGLGGLPLPLDDPMADRLRTALGTDPGPAQVVERLLAVPEVFDPGLAAHRELRDLLVEDVAALTGPVD